MNGYPNNSKPLDPVAIDIRISRAAHITPSDGAAKCDVGEGGVRAGLLVLKKSLYSVYTVHSRASSEGGGSAGQPASSSQFFISR